MPTPAPICPSLKVIGNGSWILTMQPYGVRVRGRMALVSLSLSHSPSLSRVDLGLTTVILQYHLDTLRNAPARHHSHSLHGGTPLDHRLPSFGSAVVISGGRSACTPCDAGCWYQNSDMQPCYPDHAEAPPGLQNPLTRSTRPVHRATEPSNPDYGTLLLPGLRNPLTRTIGSIHLVHGTPSSLIQTTQTTHLLADAVRSQHDPNRIHNATTLRAALRPLIRSMYALVVRR